MPHQALGVAVGELRASRVEDIRDPRRRSRRPEGPGLVRHERADSRRCTLRQHQIFSREEVHCRLNASMPRLGALHPTSTILNRFQNRHSAISEQPLGASLGRLDARLQIDVGCGHTIATLAVIAEKYHASFNTFDATEQWAPPKRL